jgi:hypothetical protein
VAKSFGQGTVRAIAAPRGVGARLAHDRRHRPVRLVRCIADASRSDPRPSFTDVTA